MTDILKHCYVDVHCGQCGEFAVRADIIAESQRLLAQGCPGSSYECPPALLATLLEPTALESLEQAWNALEGGARAPVQHVQVGDSLRVHLRRREERARRDKAGSDTARLDTARWDDDGGYISPRDG